MRTVSNVIGRILLFVAGGLIIFSAVVGIMAALKVLNDPAIGWWNFASEEGRAALGLFFLSIANGLIGLTAIFAGFRGRRSFWLFIFAAILMITPVYTIVTQVRAGTFSGTWEQIGSLILEFSTPIMYFVAMLLLVRTKNN